jgi:hypothetical protein
MSAASRVLQVGDKVKTKFSGRWTMHTITERRENQVSQSRILFRVTPYVSGSSSRDGIDADWFEPA